MLVRSNSLHVERGSNPMRKEHIVVPVDEDMGEEVGRGTRHTTSSFFVFSCNSEVTK